METAYEAEPALAAPDSFTEEMKIFAFSIVFSLILISVFRFGFRSNRGIGKELYLKIRRRLRRIRS